MKRWAKYSVMVILLLVLSFELFLRHHKEVVTSAEKPKVKIDFVFPNKDGVVGVTEHTPANNFRSKPESPCTSCDSAVGIAELKYRVAVKYRNVNGTLVMHVSPRSPVRLDRDGVIAFACKLHNDFATESDIFVRLFDNDSAAKKYVDPSAQHKPPDWQAYAKSFKAFYSWNSKTNQNFVAWDFDPLVPSDQQKSYSHADFCLPQSATDH